MPDTLTPDIRARARRLADELTRHNYRYYMLDDPEIAEVAARYGAEVPFLRPADLAQDDTLDLPVFQHADHITVLR